MYHIYYMENLVFFLSIFWITILASTVIMPVIINFLHSSGIYYKKNKDTKKTILDKADAVEFNKIREREKDSIKSLEVPRVGGLSLIVVFFPIGIVIATLTQSVILAISVFCVSVATLFSLYDDLTTVGKINRREMNIKKRFIGLAMLMSFYGWSFYVLLPNYLSFAPVSFFENVYVGPLMILLFPMWVIFWQASSIIDGIDGLSGTVYLVLFMGIVGLSVLSENLVVLSLAIIAIGILIPWLFLNYFPAAAYLTETGITFLTTLFAVCTFLLATGVNGGEGLWVGIIFGGVLIATWVSNIIQLVFRYKKGRKFFHIAPYHHHLESCGYPGSVVVTYYMLITLLLVLIGITFVILI